MNILHIGKQVLELSEPVVMAIINVTPDSFFAGSRTVGQEEIRIRIDRAVTEGASIIDVGGYSSRPGAEDVSPEEELKRVLTAVEVVRTYHPDMVVSIDTFRASVADGVMSRLGECVINDISAGELDAGMLGVAARYDVPYIAMHMRGTPADMQCRTGYVDIVSEVTDYLAGRAEVAWDAGVKQVILDPGFGFAKTTQQNYELLGGLDRLKMIGYPVLAGVSRKSMIYKVLETSPDDSLYGTVALGWECLRKGADILRVHDVKPAADSVALYRYYRNCLNL